MIFPPKPKNRFHLGLKKAEDPEAHGRYVGSMQGTWRVASAGPKT